jgi:DNA-binding winged helix-turn-helix (wHTH) protein
LIFDVGRGRPPSPRREREQILLYFFESYALDTDRRELKCANELIGLEPQVFDLLVLLIENHDRVVSKDNLIASVWQGRSNGP